MDLKTLTATNVKKMRSSYSVRFMDTTNGIFLGLRTQLAYCILF